MSSCLHLRQLAQAHTPARKRLELEQAQEIGAAPSASTLHTVQLGRTDTAASYLITQRSGERRRGGGFDEHDNVGVRRPASMVIALLIVVHDNRALFRSR